MSFVELIDMAVHCLIIFCGCKVKRADVDGEEVVEKTEYDLRFEQLEGQLKVCISKIAFLENQLATTSKNIKD